MEIRDVFSFSPRPFARALLAGSWFLTRGLLGNSVELQLPAEPTPLCSSARSSPPVCLFETPEDVSSRPCLVPTVQECMAQHQDWRQCQPQVQAFRDCMSEQQARRREELQRLKEQSSAHR
ncbi:hypothetical protein AB1E19_011148 [Capra hircus]